MARRKYEIIEEATNEKEFYNILDKNMKTLICVEVYCKFAGYSTAFSYLLQRMKLDWSNGEMIVVRVQADEIEDLKRFHHHSEPAVMFILGRKVTAVIRGVKPIKLTEIAKEEIRLWRQYLKTGFQVQRTLYEISEVTAGEEVWIKNLTEERNNETAQLVAKKTKRQEDRKFHRAKVLVPHLENLNFVLFWPHALNAHPELYELWGDNDIVMIAREEILFTEEKAKDALYQGDPECLNEASIAFLLSGKALAICFRHLDNQTHFATLMRTILYKDYLPVDEDESKKEAIQPKTAFDKYKSYSQSKEHILRSRREEKIRKKEEELEKRANRLAEMQRLAKEAIIEAKEAKKQNREHLKLELLKSGKLDELKQLENEPEDDEVDIEIPEELPEDLEYEASDEEVENEDEYFPPAGLLIPGFYSPPNDIAKCNGLALLFPQVVKDYVNALPEFLPEHVLVMLAIDQRYKAIEILKGHKDAVLNMGIFKASSPRNAKHLAFTVTQFDSMSWIVDEIDMRLCIMVSTLKDTTLLKLMDLDPMHVSRDTIIGEEECANLFAVDYGDGYPNLYEDFDVKEEKTNVEQKLDETK